MYFQRNQNVIQITYLIYSLDCRFAQIRRYTGLLLVANFAQFKKINNQHSYDLKMYHRTINFIFVYFLLQASIKYFEFKNLLMSSIQIRVCGRFRLQQTLYQGQQSIIYKATNVQSNYPAAVKAERKDTTLIHNEGRILQNIQGGVGVPQLYWYGLEQDYNLMAIELMGPSLADYFDLCRGKLSLKTVLMLAEQLIANIEYLHFRGYLHRNINPDNFLVGRGKKLNRIYTIDYAYATEYINYENNKHIPAQYGARSIFGCIRYASLNVHRGILPSRRDDLESLGYMLIQFIKGKLPWTGIQSKTVQEKATRIGKLKEQLSVQLLCSNIPIEFERFLLYCRGLQYEQKPDYSYLKRLFRELLIKQAEQYDYIYDWTLIPVRELPFLKSKQIKFYKKSLSYRHLIDKQEHQHQNNIPVTRQKMIIPSEEIVTESLKLPHSDKNIPQGMQKQVCLVF